MRVVVADDSVLLREGVVRLLEEKGFEVVGQAGDAEDLIRKVKAHKPDVAVVDIRMPPTNTDDGLRAALEIRAELPDTGVLVLSQYVEEGYALELVGDVGRRRRLSAEGPRGGRGAVRGRGAGAWPTAARRSTPRWCRSWSAAPAATTRSTSSRRASARCSS